METKLLLIKGGNYLESKEISEPKQQMRHYQPEENHLNKILSFGPNPNAKYFKISCVLSDSAVRQTNNYMLLKLNYVMLHETLTL